MHAEVRKKREKSQIALSVRLLRSQRMNRSTEAAAFVCSATLDVCCESVSEKMRGGLKERGRAGCKKKGNSVYSCSSLSVLQAKSKTVQWNQPQQELSWTKYFRPAQSCLVESRVVHQQKSPARNIWLNPAGLSWVLFHRVEAIYPAVLSLRREREADCSLQAVYKLTIL